MTLAQARAAISAAAPALEIVERRGDFAADLNLALADNAQQKAFVTGTPTSPLPPELDLGAATVGSIGIAASGNINPEREYPSCFEPVHGSAPVIVGKGIANPLGQVWSGAMMLDHLGEAQAARLLEKAMVEVLNSGVRTPDLGGKATTKEVTQALIDAIPKLAK